MKLNPAARGRGRDQDSDIPHQLTAVELVIRVHPQLPALRHVALQVDSFLFSSVWTLEKASEHGFVRLLDRLLPLEWSGVTDRFRRWRLHTAIAQPSYSLGVLQWWMDCYLPKCPQELSDVIQIRLHLPSQSSTRRSITPEEHIQYTKWAIKQRELCEVTNISSALESAVNCGRLDELQWLHAQTSERCSEYTLQYALSLGHLSIAKWLYTSYPAQFFADPWEVSSDLKVVQWVMLEYNWRSESHRTTCIDRSVNYAISSCKSEENAEDILRLVQFLISVRPERIPIPAKLPMGLRFVCLEWRPDMIYDPIAGTETMNEAASCGLLEVVQWLHWNDTGGCTDLAMYRAASNGHLEVVQWLHVNRPEGCTTHAMDAAASNGHLNVVQWLHMNRTEGCTARAMDQAASHGHLDVIQWLHTKRSEGCTTDAMDQAVAHGHLEVVQWLHANRTEGGTKGEIREDVYSANPMYGLLRVSILTESGLIRAAVNGHLEMIQWMHVHRPEYFMDGLINVAAFHGHLEVVKWLHANRSTCFTTEPMNRAASEGHLDILKFLDTCDQCNWTPVALKQAIERGHLDVVRWLLKRKPSGSIDQEFVKLVAQGGHFEILKELEPEHLNLHVWDLKFLSKLANYGHFATVEWALRRRRSQRSVGQ